MSTYKTVVMDNMVATETSTMVEAVGPITSEIERQAAAGYDFVDMYNVPVLVKVGCFKSYINALTGKSRGDYYVYVLTLVFKKSI